MVFFFTLHCDPTVTIYMGRDKYENEELIRWGWPEDIWFHVDDLSSAHVYVRMPPGKGFADLTPEMIDECAQLVKANSIKGAGLPEVYVCYTPWANLKKTGGMDVGQVGFHDERLRKLVKCVKDNMVVKRLEKTRVEKNEVNYREEREQRDARMRREEKAKMLAQQEAERVAREEQQRAHDMKHYTSLHDEGAMRTNREVPPEDDFM